MGSRILPSLPFHASWDSHSVSILLPSPSRTSYDDLILVVPLVQPLPGKIHPAVVVGEKGKENKDCSIMLFSCGFITSSSRNE